MPAPVTATMPPALELGAGYTLRVNAVDPSTGAQVTGVTLTSVTLTVSNIGGGAATDLEFGPFRLVPGPGA